LSSGRWGSPGRGGQLALLLLAGFWLLPVAAQAGCTDAPAPRVDWRRCLFDEATLAGRDLSDALLRDASFGRANLQGALLFRVNAQRVKFLDADLAGARLDGADLIDADFSNAKLAGASFKGADLRRAHFFKADLVGADFTGARLDGTDFFDAKLSGALWTDGTHRCATGSSGRCD